MLDGVRGRCCRARPARRGAPRCSLGSTGEPIIIRKLLTPGRLVSRPSRCAMKLFSLFGNRSERRESRRHGVIHTAWVRTASDPLPFVCVLWDVSDGGARLSVAQPEALPDTVTVTLKREDTAGTVCRVAWRDRDQIGIEFLN